VFFFKLDIVLHHYLRASQINNKYPDQAKLDIDLVYLTTESLQDQPSFIKKPRDRLHAYSQRPNLRKSFETGCHRRGPRIGNRDTSFFHWYYTCHRNHSLQKALRVSGRMDLKVVAREMEFS
jgi:hypothetical protein